MQFYSNLHLVQVKIVLKLTLAMSGSIYNFLTNHFFQPLERQRKRKRQRYFFILSFSNAYGYISEYI